MLAGFLGREGYKTRLAADGQIALRKIAEETPDIVLLDLTLPGMSGLAILEQINKIYPGIIVIILTGYGSIQNAVQTMKLGAYDFMIKPFDYEKLLTILKHACDLIDLRREQAKLNASHAKYFDLYDQAPAGYLTLGEQGLILEANLTAAKLLGVDNKSQLVNQPLTRFITPDERAIFDRCRQELFKTGAPQMCDLLMVHNDRTPFWAHLESVVPQNHAAALTFWITLSDITEHRRLEQLREEQRLLRQLMAISRELHDGLGGLAANTGILAELGRRQAVREEDKKIFLNIADLAGEMNSEIHGLMNTIENHDVRWSDLVEECRQYGAALMATHDMKFKLGVTGNLDIPGPQLWSYSSLARIYKEALMNIIKHSGATQVQVALQFDPDRLSMEIRDNGRGFTATHTPGRGLGNMRSRAVELGGTLNMRTQDGVVLRFEFPIPLQWVEKEAGSESI